MNTGDPIIADTGTRKIKTVTPAAFRAVISAQDTAAKGVANGYASLGADGKVPAAQIPADIQAHVIGTGSPHTAAGVGADPAGAATGAVEDHESAYDHSKLHDPVTVGAGLSLFGQQVTNTDIGSVAVSGHEETYDHTPLHNMDEISEALVDADEILVYNTSAAANRKSLLSRVWTYVKAKADLVYAAILHAATHNPNGSDPLVGYKRYNGFVNQTDSVISVDGSGVFTIAPAVTSYVVYSGGVKFTKSSPETVNITTDQDLHFVYFNSAGVLTVSTTEWSILSDNIPIATVYKDSTNYALQNERHGYDHNRSWHEWAHDNIRTMYHGGFAGTFGNTTFSIEQGIVADEDLESDSGGTKTACRLWYRNTGLTSMRFESAISTPWKSNAGAPQYDNAGTMADVGVAKFFASFFYGTGDTSYPIYIVAGQDQYNTLALAQAAALPSILLDVNEWKLLYRVIYRESGGSATWIETADFRAVANLPVGAVTPTDHAVLSGRDVANSHSATAISNTAAGGIVATTVQAAIDELDTEKISKATLTTAGDLLYHTTVPAALPIGTAGQVLTVNGAATAPEWAAPTLPFVAVDGTLATGANADVVASKLVYNKTCSDSDGNDVIDLHDGTVIGQVLTIHLGTKSGSDNAVITPVTKLGYSTITLDTVAKLATLQWQGAVVGWAILYTSGTVA